MGDDQRDGAATAGEGEIAFVSANTTTQAADPTVLPSKETVRSDDDGDENDDDDEKRTREEEELQAARQKTKDILDACKWRDLDRLRTLADAPGGFLTDELRREAC